MTPEQIWLLKYGRGWIHWYELADEDGDGVDDLLERMHEARLLKTDSNRMCVRLKTEKERDESIRV
jgi:hypothetical protein